LVAVVSLPLAILQLVGIDGFYNVPAADFFKLLGLMIIAVAYFAYRAESQFGFTVFALVGAAVAMTGFGMGAFENIAFGLVFVLAIIWSIFAKTPKNLTLILVTTALIFLFVGFALYQDSTGASFIGTDPTFWHWLIGIAALFNFIFNIFLAYALALEDKLPIF